MTRRYLVSILVLLSTPPLPAVVLSLAGNFLAHIVPVWLALVNQHIGENYLVRGVQYFPYVRVILLVNTLNYAKNTVLDVNCPCLSINIPYE